MRTVLGFTVVMLLLSAAAGAQTGPESGDPIMARLSAEKAGAVTPGLYSAGDNRAFTLEAYRGKYLLRFGDGGESFVLTADAGSLGAKLLKYDTGAAALSVSVWGGVTLYAADAPGGLPATRQGDAAPLLPAPVSATSLKAAVEDEGSHFSYADNLGLRFAVDPASFADAYARALAFDALSNTQAGIERFVAGAPAARAALARRINLVKLEKAAKPGMGIAGRTLVVRYDPAEGFLGRASSHAVAHQLGKLLSVATPE